jgi:hypothetical protein
MTTPGPLNAGGGASDGNILAIRVAAAPPLPSTRLSTKYEKPSTLPFTPFFRDEGQVRDTVLKYGAEERAFAEAGP